MGVTATVPILPGAAVNQERSYASSCVNSVSLWLIMQHRDAAGIVL